MTDALQAALDAAATAHDRAGWALAKLAYEWRAERIPNWAARIGSHPRLRKSARTVQGWAQAYASWHTLKLDPAVMGLPFSAWEIWHKYLITGDDPTERNAKLVAVLTQWAAEPVGTIEGLAAFLSEAFGDEPGRGNGWVEYPVVTDDHGRQIIVLPERWISVTAKVKA